MEYADYLAELDAEAMAEAQYHYEQMEQLKKLNHGKSE